MVESSPGSRRWLTQLVIVYARATGIPLRLNWSLRLLIISGMLSIVGCIMFVAIIMSGGRRGVLTAARLTLSEARAMARLSFLLS